MKRFDAFLRRGLMDANLAQFERDLRQADRVEFSPRYLRERARLLADPWGWTRRRPLFRRGVARGIAVAAAVLLLVTAAVAVSAPLWVSFFGGLDQRQQEIVGEMEIGGEEAKETASRLPPPVEHDGVTITPLRLLAAKNRFYLMLEIRAPEGTVFSPEDRYQLFGGVSLPMERRTEIEVRTSGFTVLEAGTREPNVLVGVEEETTSFDISGCPFVVRALYRRTEDGKMETVFQASDSGTWDFLIPEDLNGDRLLEPRVEGLTMTDEQKTMTLLSMSVSPLGIWWRYRLEGEDLWPEVRIALRMKDGSIVEAAPGQMTKGDQGAGCTAAVDFAKPVDLSQAEAVLWGDVEIPLEQTESNEE